MKMPIMPLKKEDRAIVAGALYDAGYRHGDGSRDGFIAWTCAWGDQWDHITVDVSRMVWAAKEYHMLKNTYTPINSLPHLLRYLRRHD